MRVTLYPGHADVQLDSPTVVLSFNLKKIRKLSSLILFHPSTRNRLIVKYISIENN